MPHSNPWAVEKALTGAVEARQLAYNAAQGQEGLAEPTDCRVSALDVPGPFINVAVGAYNILSRGPGAGRQMYTGRITETDKVAVTPTSSTGGRTDLVCIRIKNPDVDGTNNPNGPYAVTEIRPNVPAGTVSIRDVEPTWSAITIARIAIPANTGTIQSTMITDLRGTTQSPYPATAQFTDIQNFTGSSALPPPALGGGFRQSAWANWPGGSSWSVPVPSWATEVALYYQVNPVLLENTWGVMAIDFNGRWTPTTTFDVNYPLLTPNAYVRYTNDGYMRASYVCGGKLAVTAAERGRSVPVRIMALSFDDVVYRSRGTSIADRGTVGYFSAAFRQAAAIS